MTIQLKNKADLADNIIKQSSIDKIYLVGGAVRDIILGRSIQDLDFVICGAGEKPKSSLLQIQHIVASLIPTHVRMNLTDRLSDFRTFNMGFSSENNEWNFDFDFVFSRAEIYQAPASKPKISAGSLEQDLLRRDFTINALASPSVSCKPTELIDFSNGLSDLTNKTLRVIHNKSFSDDPLRMVRGFRFKYRLGFEFDTATFNLMKSEVSALTLCLATFGRRYFEFQKVFSESYSQEIIIKLVEVGIFKQLLGLSDDFNSEMFCDAIANKDHLDEMICLELILKNIECNETQLKYLSGLPISKKMKTTLRACL